MNDFCVSATTPRKARASPPSRWSSRPAVTGGRLDSSLASRLYFRPISQSIAAVLLWNGFVDLISFHGALGFYPVKASGSFDSVFRVKPIRSSDNRAKILTCLVHRPVNQRLKRLMHILNAGLQQRRAVIRS